MTEATGLIHIERHSFRMELGIAVKEEGGFGVDESLD